MQGVIRKPTIVSSQKRLYFGAISFYYPSGVQIENSAYNAVEAALFEDAVARYIEMTVDMPQGSRGVRSIKLFFEDPGNGNVVLNYDYSLISVGIADLSKTAGNSGNFTDTTHFTNSHLVKAISLPQAVIDDINANLGNYNKLDLIIGRLGADAADTLLADIHLCGILVNLK